MIIDTSYFTGPLVIAQLGQPSVVNTVNQYIADGEADLLPRALGISLYEALIAGIEVGSDEVVEDKWTKLIEGETYTSYNGSKYKFAGLENIIPSFVWFHYTRDLITQQAGIGTVQANAENARVVTPDLSRAWNNMIKQVDILWDYLYTNRETYTDYLSTEVDKRFFGNGTGTINQFGI